MLSDGKLEEGMTLKNSTLRLCGILVDITMMYPASLNGAVIAETTVNLSHLHPYSLPSWFTNHRVLKSGFLYQRPVLMSKILHEESRGEPYRENLGQ